MSRASIGLSVGRHLHLRTRAGLPKQARVRVFPSDIGLITSVFYTRMVMTKLRDDEIVCCQAHSNDYGVAPRRNLPTQVRQLCSPIWKRHQDYMAYELHRKRTSAQLMKKGTRSIGCSCSSLHYRHWFISINCSSLSRWCWLWVLWL